QIINIKTSNSIINNKLLESESAVKFLCYGFDFDESRFNEVLGMLEETMCKNVITPLDYYSDEEYIDILESALLNSIEEALNEANTNEVRIGITGGLDSRLLFSGLREILPEENIYTFTLGYPGQYDYEFARKFE